MKIALFDFCDTIVSFQTADEFVRFTLEKFGSYGDAQMAGHKLSKEELLYQLKGFSKIQLEDAAEHYYSERIKPCIYKSMIVVIKTYQRKNFRTYIVSGGYSIYINRFKKEYAMDGVIANEFSYEEDKFTGYMLEKDCMRDEKVNRISKIFATMGKIEESVSFSDSKTDLPLLKWTDRGVVVSHTSHREWVKLNGLEEIVLSDMGEEII